MDAENFLHRHQSGFCVHFDFSELHAARMVRRKPRLPLAVNDERDHAKFFARGRPVFPARVGEAGLCLQLLQRLRANIKDRRRDGGTRRAAAAAGAGREIGIADTHRDLLRFEAEDFRRHNGDHRARAGADVLHAKAKFNAAVGINLRLALRVPARAARRPRRAGTTDARFHHARGTAGLLIFLFPAEFLRTQFVFALTDRVRVVLEPEFHRVQAEFHGEIVHRGLHAKRRGRIPRRTKGAGGTGVDRDRRLLHARVRNFVKIGCGNIRAAAAAARIAAGTDPGRAIVFHLKGVQHAIRRRAHFYFLKTRRTIAHGKRLVEAREHQPHGRFGGAGKFRRKNAFDARAEFRAEAAAHIFGDDAHLAVIKLQRAGQTVAHAGDSLGRRPRLNAFVRPRNRVAHGLHRIVNLHGRRVKSLNHRRAFGKRRVHAAVLADVRG